MGFDELGADPYQRAAVSCARKGAVSSALLLCGAVGCFVHGWVSDSGNFVMMAGPLFVTSLLVLLASQRQLAREDLAWKDIC